MVFKFIFDEAGAKTENDKEHEFGVVSGFILKTEQKEKILVEEIKKIIEKYNLKELKKIHLSAISDVEKRKSIQLEILELLNNLEIVWTYGSVKKNCIQKVNIKDRLKFGIPNLYESCILVAFINAIDYYEFYHKKNKNDQIKLISDNIDQTIKDNFSKVLKKICNCNGEKKYEINTGYNKEKRKPIIGNILTVKSDIPPLKLPKYTWESENSYLTFVADVLTYHTFQILKNESIEKQFNCHEIMKTHICKYLFIYSNEIDEYFNSIY